MRNKKFKKKLMLNKKTIADLNNLQMGWAKGGEPGTETCECSGDLTCWGGRTCEPLCTEEYPCPTQGATCENCPTNVGKTCEHPCP